jgi:hypothetical protein
MTTKMSSDPAVKNAEPQLMRNATELERRRAAKKRERPTSSAAGMKRLALGALDTVQAACTIHGMGDEHCISDSNRVAKPGCPTGVTAQVV